MGIVTHGSRGCKQDPWWLWVLWPIAATVGLRTHSSTCNELVTTFIFFFSYLFFLLIIIFVILTIFILISMNLRKYIYFSLILIMNLAFSNKRDTFLNRRDTRGDSRKAKHQGLGLCSEKEKKNYNIYTIVFKNWN